MALSLTFAFPAAVAGWGYHCCRELLMTQKQLTALQKMQMYEIRRCYDPTNTLQRC